MWRRVAGISILTAIALGAIGGVVALSQSGGPDKTFALMNGVKEIPDADLNGTGAAHVTTDSGTNEVCIDIRFARIATPTGMHIHTGDRNTNGPILVPFTATGYTTGSECVTTLAANIAAMEANPAGFYVNVHTASEFPAGAIRGQLSASKP